MWKRRSHILAPLAELAGGKKNSPYKWLPKHMEAFEEAKWMIARKAMLAYPDFNKPFEIYTDASDYQLGGVIMQANKPLAFYTHKLNKSQKNYTTGEQELLGIVETLKCFENILYSQKLIIYTDHLNLLYKKLSRQRMNRWWQLLEEYGPEIKHVPGEKNVIADALSRLDMEDNGYDTIEFEPPRQPLKYSYVTKQDIDEEKFPIQPKLISKRSK